MLQIDLESELAPFLFMLGRKHTFLDRDRSHIALVEGRSGHESIPHVTSVA
jgi:hypothetical protein